jgi:DNA gyrase/topoisomerase IV subunit B
MTFYFEGGLRSLVAFYNRTRSRSTRNIFYVEKEADGVAVEIALQYVDDITPRIFAVRQQYLQPEGGTHMTGFQDRAHAHAQLLRAQRGISQREAKRTSPATTCSKGLTAVVSVKLPRSSSKARPRPSSARWRRRARSPRSSAKRFNNFLKRIRTTRARSSKGHARAQGAQGREGRQRLGASQGRARGHDASGQARRLPEQRRIRVGALSS